ncbi:MAG: glycosyl hydrolase family 18 protein [bacterium]|nr:glycosyl hydrolase family 18 protein [bacterium]
MTWKNAIILIFFGVLCGIFAVMYFFIPSRSTEVSPVTYSAPLEITPDPNPVRKQVIGFLPSWSVAAKAKVNPEYLDQIIYFGIGINKNGELMKVDEEGKDLLEWHYFKTDYMKNVMSKAHETDTKILVTIKNFDNEEIDTLISSGSATNRAISQISKLITDYELDGINIDFEYFSDSDFPTAKHMNIFLEKLTTQLKKEHPNTIISFDVNATAIYEDKAYDMVRIGELVDQVIVMGYDYHRQSSTVSGAVAPLVSKGDAPSVTKSIDSLKGRVPYDKVILAIPLYGYEWQTYSKDQGSYTIPGSGALASYKRVRELIESKDDVAISYDKKSMSPRLVYVQSGAIKQIYYEDEKSIKSKLELVHDRDIAGIALWALGYEGTYLEPWLLIKDTMRDL